MKALDTNVLVRLVALDDEDQVRQARAYLARERAHSPFWINRVVLCELIWVMTRAFGVGRDQVAALLADLLRSRDVEIEDFRVVQTALYMYRVSRAEFADCLICVSNGLAGCERTATFDRRAAELDEFELI
ncbi:MAG: type II toxin-antitoxin system VapC family toxin [Geminicoccaceae bacterium]|nr:type II toxin-antitoxin system VapC family toxin [Geminicoccaceae bacterium]